MGELLSEDDKASVAVRLEGGNTERSVAVSGNVTLELLSTVCQGGLKLYVKNEFKRHGFTSQIFTVNYTVD